MAALWPAVNNTHARFRRSAQAIECLNAQSLRQPLPACRRGEQHSVREFTERAFAEVGVTLRFEGEGPDEVGMIDHVDASRLAAVLDGDRRPETGATLLPGQIVVRVDPRYYRPTELYSLLGDASKARRVLGWEPRCGFEQLVSEMMREDLAEARGEKADRGRVGEAVKMPL